MLCHDQEPIVHGVLPGETDPLLHGLLDVPYGTLWNGGLLLHSELRSQAVQHLSDTLKPVYYWSHALIAHDWFRFARHDPLLQQKSTVRKHFLVYNRAWSGSREYRLGFVDRIIDQNLVQHCQTSFAPVDNKHYSEHNFANTAWRPKHQLENFLKPNNYPSQASADYCAADYQNTAVEVVLETLFDDARWHLTEKTLRPIACAHPFILAGPQGSLQYLKQYGFQTFDPLICETYDNINDPVDRMDAITAEMQRLITHDRFDYILRSLQDIAKFNQQRFFSAVFFDQVVEEYLCNLNTAVHCLQLSDQVFEKRMSTSNFCDQLNVFNGKAVSYVPEPIMHQIRARYQALLASR